MAERKGFFLYHDDIKAISTLSNEQKGILLDALMIYSSERKRLETQDKVLAVVFNIMAVKIDLDIEKYEAKCKRNRKNVMQRYDRILPNTTVDSGIPSNTTENNGIQLNTTVNERIQENQGKGETKNDKKSSTTVYDRIPSNTTVNERIQTLPIPKPIPKPNPIPNQTNVRELYPQGIPPTPFIPPTLEDVDEFCEAQGIDVDPVRFVMYYTARGWKMGTTPMTDWKAAVRLWEQRDKAEAQKQAPAPIDNDEPVNWYEG